LLALLLRVGHLLRRHDLLSEKHRHNAVFPLDLLDEHVIDRRIGDGRLGCCFRLLGISLGGYAFPGFRDLRGIYRRKVEWRRKVDWWGR
jgi:hypothetical protein